MKKIFPVILVALMLAAFAIFPAFAFDGTPPEVPAPAFDWAVISQALQAIFTAFLIPVATFAARWMFAQGNYQKSLLSKEQKYAFDLAVNVFVYAAEQMKLRGMINDKLTFVIERLEAWLAENNMTMDLQELRARIESAVIKEFPKKAG